MGRSGRCVDVDRDPAVSQKRQEEESCPQEQIEEVDDSQEEDPVPEEHKQLLVDL